MTIEKPSPALLSPSPRLSYDPNAASSENLTTTATHHEPARPKSEYDPFALAKVGSPFYQWNHDSPRASESKPRPDINISVQDLEAGLTPISTQQHGIGSSPVLREKKSHDSGQLRNGTWRNRFGVGAKECMTKPRVSRWKSMPKKQRLLIKSVLAVIMVGLIVGLAVGLTKALGGGVWRSNNSTSAIQ